MNSESSRQEWHYLNGLEVKGPVSLDQLAALIASGALPNGVMVANQTTSPQWRSAAEVIAESLLRQNSSSAPPPNPPPSSASAANRKSGSSLAEDLLQRVSETLNEVAGTEKLEGFNLKEMFSETFQHRTVAEMEEYLIVGTARTTPPISEVQTGWPKPWLFARFLVFFGLVYFGFVFAYQQFQNLNLVPGLILMGSFATPIATLILFFELNTPRNVSFYRLVVLLGLGGIASLFISLIGFDLANLNWLGASGAGIIEELGKLAALILIVRSPRYKYVLNGMLFGAAVGAGFAAFESAGYAFNSLVSIPGVLLNTQMLHTIAIRAILAPLMHVAWTAMVGAALWRVKKDKPVTIDTLKDPRFWRVLGLAMILHMLWNAPFSPPFFLKQIVLGAGAWFVIWGLVQQGLRQVRDEQRALASSASSAATRPNPA